LTHCRSLKNIIVRTDGSAHLQCISRGASGALLSDEDIARRVHNYTLKQEPLLTLGHIASQARAFSIVAVGQARLPAAEQGDTVPVDVHGMFNLTSGCLHAN
jgi:hypothetical protein